MPRPSPLHARTAPLCDSHAWKIWGGYYAVRHYGACGEPEYHAFRHAAGMLDVSPLFKYEFRGADAARYLSWVWARDVSKLKPGRVTYGCLCDPEGFIIDDGTITRIDETTYRCTTAAPSLHWFARHARGFDVDIEDASEKLAAIALQGPRSRDVLNEASDGLVDGLGFFRATSGQIAGVDVDVTRTGYTGDLGYEIWIPSARAVDVWDALVGAGRRHAVMPAGLDALDLTRVEAGFVLQDTDYYSAPGALVRSRKSTPFELDLGWTVQLDRDPFIGQTALREHAKNPEWAFVGLEIDWQELLELYDEVGLPPSLPTAAWRTPLPVFDGVDQIGQATSGAWSPLLKRNLALASVKTENSEIGTRLKIEQTVEFHRHHVTATVVPKPFFDPERKRSLRPCDSASGATRS